VHEKLKGGRYPSSTPKARSPPFPSPHYHYTPLAVASSKPPPLDSHPLSRGPSPAPAPAAPHLLAPRPPAFARRYLSLIGRRPAGPMAFNYHDHALAMDPAAAAAVGAAANPSFVSGGGMAGGPGWEREKAAIAAHPLYERLLEAHVACLRVATPVDQLPRIDAQIAARPPPMEAAAAAAAAGGAHSGGEELDLFMVSTHTFSSLFLL
jgi:hypothetical protein